MCLTRASSNEISKPHERDLRLVSDHEQSTFEDPLNNGN